MPPSTAESFVEFLSRGTLGHEGGLLALLRLVRGHVPPYAGEEGIIGVILQTDITPGVYRRHSD